jgi:hypothetical protein
MDEGWLGGRMECSEDLRKAMITGGANWSGKKEGEKECLLRSGTYRRRSDLVEPLTSESCAN